MKQAKPTQLYSSPNGDTWFLVPDPETGVAFVRHQANISSGGQVTDILIDPFLSGPQNPEHEALLRLMGSLVPVHGADTAVEPEVESPRREWSDAELSELEDLLMCEISIKEIARLLERDQGDVQDKVIEIGRACR
jgi:hypothetical protein